MSRFAPGDRVHITSGEPADQDGTVGHVQDSGPGWWIVVDGVAGRALVRAEHLGAVATVADHGGHDGMFCRIPWSFEELGIAEDDPCKRPAYVVLVDSGGEERLACADHWQHALIASDGAIRANRLV